MAKLGLAGGRFLTICVAVSVHDGAVFAADSASTLSSVKPSGETDVLNVYKHGLKVFNLYKGLPLGAMTCGIGNFGPSSIASLAKEFRYQLSKGTAELAINSNNYTIQEVVDRAKTFLFDGRFAHLDPRPQDQFEFWIGGYPSDMAGEFELWKIIFLGGDCLDPQRMNTPGLSWGGAITPVTRLLLGFDHTLAEALSKAIGLDPANPDPDKAAQLESLIGLVRSHSQVVLHSPVMPMQDAIDLADFLAETAKRYFHFLPGADIVGGDTDIATITRYEGFRWIRRKHYYPAHLNPMETGHA